jgi:hypothetical protein
MKNHPFKTLFLLSSNILTLLVLFSSGYEQTCLNPDPEIEGHLPKNKTAYYVYQQITGNPQSQIDSAFGI